MIRHTSPAALLLFCAGALPAWSQLPSLPPGQTHYQLLDRIEDEWVNRNPVPVRPMLFFPDATVWAVNPYLSEIARIPLPPAEPTRFRTLPGPVSIASYQPVASNTQLLVVCQHVNAVAIHDAVSGDMLKAVKVRAQPADIVVDQINHRAWVSCPAADSVVELDLTQANPETTARVYPLVTSKFPTFLSLYVQSPGVEGDPLGNVRVLVAPRVSGNGSLVDRKPVSTLNPDNPPTLDINEHAGPLGIRDTLDVEVAASPDDGLPDHDLFWLDPSSSPPTARPVARSTGTLLFANGILPGTTGGNTLWQLNLESLNKTRNAQTGGSIQGNFVANRLTKVNLPQLVLGSSPSLVTPAPDADQSNSPGDEIRSLDDVDLAPDIQLPGLDDPRAIGTPYSLAFHVYPAFTLGFVVGLMTDNIVALNTSGTRFGSHISLPEGTMPRQVLANPSGQILAVWGSGGLAGPADCRVLFYNLSGVQVAAIPVGPDPTPALVREGRRLFFDASHSAHNNASCASCHDEGKTDMLAWNLSKIAPLGDETSPDALPDDDGVDNKGPMVTQTLTGIRTAQPFHWRGEQQRGLADFNGAFPDLLGGDALDGLTFDAEGDPVITPGGEFDAFQAFVLSLTEDANQVQHKNRVLSDSIQPPGISGASAQLGQEKFSTTCMGCHSLPKGTNNEVANNDFSGEHLTRRLWLDVASYQGLQFKGMPTIDTVTLLSGQGGTFPEDAEPASQTYPVLGTGLAHAGVVNDLRTFMLTMLAGETQQVRDDVTSFVWQFDTGVAPAAHGFVLMNAGNAASAQLAVNSYLLVQAGGPWRNCDVAVVGRLSTSPPGTHSGWAYNRGTQQFLGETGNPVNLNFFRNDALAGGWFAFAGMPLGTAKKHAIDFDRDEILNGNEASEASRHAFDAPADVPGAPVINPNGPAVAFQWLTGRVGRLTFETSELTTATLQLVSTDPPHVVVEQETTPKMQHNLVVSNLIPSRRDLADVNDIDDTTYTVTLTVMDHGGASTQTSWSIVMPAQQDRIVNVDSVVVSSFSGTPTFGTDIDYTATGAISRRLTLPPEPSPSMLVIARLFINGVPAGADDFLPNGNNPLLVPFQVNGEDYHVDPALGIVRLPPPPFLRAFTDVSGQFTLSFTLKGTSLAVGDVATVAIEAIGRSLPNLINMQGTGEGDAFDDEITPTFVPSRWSFPDTPSAMRALTFQRP